MKRRKRTEGGAHLADPTDAAPDRSTPARSTRADTTSAPAATPRNGVSRPHGWWLLAVFAITAVAVMWLAYDRYGADDTTPPPTPGLGRATLPGAGVAGRPPTGPVKGVSVVTTTTTSSTLPITTSTQPAR